MHTLYQPLYQIPLPLTPCTRPLIINSFKRPSKSPYQSPLPLPRALYFNFSKEYFKRPCCTSIILILLKKKREIWLRPLGLGRPFCGIFEASQGRIPNLVSKLPLLVYYSIRWLPKPSLLVYYRFQFCTIDFARQLSYNRSRSRILVAIPKVAIFSSSYFRPIKSGTF